ncbi:glycosyltransferase [Bordetella petrii]|uniref:Glycosyltransferase n=1 Tax=Bordetella petrii TaxID=94624 RepID=A0ABT7VXU9_9BORD|nr:glycosyltransferase [Bordetella petrii]MDM9557761.1 glycosyltransferase [Bordetella petrii]
MANRFASQRAAADTSEAGVTDGTSIAPSEPSRLLRRFHAPVEPGSAYRIYTAVTDATQHVSKQALLLALRFQDCHDRTCDAPVADWTFSQRYKRWVTYVPSHAAAQDFVSRPVVAPDNAAQLDVMLIRWKASVDVEIAQGPDIRQVADSVESFRQREEVSVDATMAALLRLFDKGPLENPALMRYAFEFAVRHQVPALLLKAGTTLLMAGNGREPSRDEILRQLDRLREADPSWQPALASNPPCAAAVQSSRKPVCVAHIWGDTGAGNYIDCLPDIIRSHPGTRVDAFIISPHEYLADDAPPMPWIRRDHAGAPHFQLASLTVRAQRELERTRVMELDTLLSLHICRDHNAALIHAHTGRRGYDLAIRGLAIARQMHLPFVYEWRPVFAVRPSQAEVQLGGDMLAMYRAQEERCMREADAIIVASEQTRSALAQRGLDPARIFVVPAALNVSKFNSPALPGHATDEAEKSLGLVAGSFRTTDQAALVANLAESAQMHLAIYGNEQELASYRTIAAQHPGLNASYINSSATDVVQFLSGLHGILLPAGPSHWTEQQLAWWIGHAMANKLPVIGLEACEAFDELLMARSHKILFAPDLKALPEVLRRIDSRSTAMISMIERAYNWISTMRNPAIVGRLYERVYKYVLCNQSTPGVGRTRHLVPRQSAR